MQTKIRVIQRIPGRLKANDSMAPQESTSTASTPGPVGYQPNGRHVPVYLRNTCFQMIFEFHSLAPYYKLAFPMYSVYMV